MKGTMRIIPVEGPEQIIEFDGRVPTLKEHRDAVGGPIEKCPLWDATEDGQPCVTYFSADGKGALGGPAQPENERATSEWERIVKKIGQFPQDKNLRDYDYLAGPVIVLSGDREWMNEL